LAGQRRDGLCLSPALRLLRPSQRSRSRGCLTVNSAAAALDQPLWRRSKPTASGCCSRSWRSSGRMAPGAPAASEARRHPKSATRGGDRATAAGGEPLTRAMSAARPDVPTIGLALFSSLAKPLAAPVCEGAKGQKSPWEAQERPSRPALSQHQKNPRTRPGGPWRHRPIAFPGSKTSGATVERRPRLRTVRRTRSAIGISLLTGAPAAPIG
jgi:hypothetical protein